MLTWVSPPLPTFTPALQLHWLFAPSSSHHFLPLLVTMVTWGPASVVPSSIAGFWDNFPSEFQLLSVISALIFLQWKKKSGRERGNPSCSDIKILSVTRRFSLGNVTSSVCFPFLRRKSHSCPHACYSGVTLNPHVTFNWLSAFGPWICNNTQQLYSSLNAFNYGSEKDRKSHQTKITGCHVGEASL